MQIQIPEEIKQKFDYWCRITPQNASYDRTFLWLFIILLSIGFVMVSSSSLTAGINIGGDPLFYIKREGIFIAISLLAFVFTLNIPMTWWEKYHGYMVVIAVILLIAVLIPGLGLTVNGATRWLNLPLLNFQPAEFTKLALSCYLSGYFVRKLDEVHASKWKFIKPFIISGFLGMLLYFQPDLGSAVCLAIITAGLLFLVGAKLWQFIVFFGVLLVALIPLIIGSAYRMKRIFAFQNPFEDYYNTGFQLSNSLMAFGRGNWIGEGLGNSAQKLGNLPEAHTDFIMAILGEELGFVGLCTTILIFGAFIFKIFFIARRASEVRYKFQSFFAFCIGIWFFVQGFVNLGGVIALIPNKGFTFPLISYGGSSIIISSIAIAILFRIDYETRLVYQKIASRL